MQDILSMLATLRRPRLLMRAARIGAQNYVRATSLPRLLGYGVLPRHGEALMQLIEMESELETQRTQDNAAYSVARHVDILIAIISEATDLRALQQAGLKAVT